MSNWNRPSAPSKWQASPRITTDPTIANTKSVYAELVAATEWPCGRLIVYVQTDGVASNDALVDIAIGASGSEQIICADLISTSIVNCLNVHVYDFPVSIPRGTRVSCRSQGTSALADPKVQVELLSPAFGFGGAAPVVTYGANTADSGGVSVDPGATAGTKGVYSELTASTTRRHTQLAIGFGGQLNAARAVALWTVDIAVGADTAEQVIVPNLRLCSSIQTDLILPSTYSALSVDIPAGSRLSVRAQCDITDATDRLFDVVLYGV